MATDAPALLLLPAPRPPAAAAAVYRAPLKAALTRLSRQQAARVLVVTIVGDMLAAGGGSARAKVEAEAGRGPGGGHGVPARNTVRWRPAQSLLAHVYGLIASVCAERHVAAHAGSIDPGAVDARVVLVHGRPAAAPLPALTAHNGTAVLDLATFAAQARPWSVVLHPSTRPGEDLVAAYLAHAERARGRLQFPTCAVDGGVSEAATRDQEGARAGHDDDGARAYSTVCLGGTFDHLHPGHKLLLGAATLLLAVPSGEGARPCTLLVGVSGDALLRNKECASELQPWEVRARSVVDFVSTVLDDATARAHEATPTELRARLRGGAAVVRCVAIDDAFGPTVTDEDIGALVVSGETRGGGWAINERRAARGWAALDVYEVDVLDAGRGAKISSTEIRRRQALARAAAGAGTG